MYNYQTSRYFIPAPQIGQAIEGTEERRLSNIIDNQIYGAVTVHTSEGNGIVSDGIYTGTFSTNNSTLTIRENKPNATVEGFISNVFIRSVTTVTITGLLDNNTYYVYAELISQTDETDAISSYAYGNFNLTSYTTEQEQVGRLLLCTVTTTAIDITVDTEPTGKIRIPRLYDHINNNIDPHTDYLYQTYLITNTVTASGVTAFEEIYCDTLTINGLLDVDNLTIRSGLSNDGVFYQNGLTTFGGTVTFLSGIFADTMIVNDLTVAGNMYVDNSLVFASNLTFNSGVTLNGRDLSVDLPAYQSHVEDYNNPHHVHASGIGALMKDGDTLVGNLSALSGITIDTVDVSLLKPLVSGEVVDSTYHSHTTTSGLKSFAEYAEYKNTVLSGLGTPTDLITLYDANNAYYKLAGTVDDNRGSLVYRNTIPSNFLEWNSPFLQITHKETGANIDESSIKVYLKDTDNTIISLEDDTKYVNDWSASHYGLAVSGLGGGTWDTGMPFTAIFELKASSGLETQLAEIKFLYKGN